MPKKAAPSKTHKFRKRKILLLIFSPVLLLIIYWVVLFIWGILFSLQRSSFKGGAIEGRWYVSKVNGIPVDHGFLTISGNSYSSTAGDGCNIERGEFVRLDTSHVDFKAGPTTMAFCIPTLLGLAKAPFKINVGGKLESVRYGKPAYDVSNGILRLATITDTIEFMRPNPEDDSEFFRWNR